MPWDTSGEWPVYTPRTPAELRDAIAQMPPEELAASLEAGADEPDEPRCCWECGWLWPEGQEMCRGCGA